MDRFLDQVGARGRAVLVGTVLLVALAFAAAVAANAGVVTGLSLAALLAARTTAAFLSLATAHHLGASAPARLWRFLGAGWLLAGLSASLLLAAWVVLDLRLATPSIADLLLMAAYGAGLWGVASGSAGSPERFGRLRSWLDAAILVLAMLGLAWLVFVQPIVEIELAPDISLFWAAVWPALDLCFLTLVLRLILVSAPGTERRAAVLLGAAGLCALVGDLAAGYFALFGEATISWVLVVMLPAAALLAGGAALEGRRVDPSRRVTPPAARRAESLLPVAFTYAVVGFTIVDGWLTGSVDLLALALSIGLTVLLFARQGVVAGMAEMRQHAALIEGAADMAFIAGMDGRVTFSNPSFDRALRRSVGDRMPLHLEEVLSGETDVAPILLQAAGSGWQGDVVFRRRDGTSFPARLSLRPVAMERRRPVLAATAVDLTRIVERERLLRSALDDVAGARAELESLNRALEAKVDERTRELQQMVLDLDRLNQELRALDEVKSDFVALVSHELRAPLTNIRTGIELLVDGEDTLPSAARNSLDLILDETKRLGGFVEAILDLSALEAGRFPLRLEPVDLGASAFEACDRFRTVGESRRIETRLPDDLPPVLADSRAVASVFHHLLDNAVKYGGEGAIVVTAEAEPERVVVSVTDHGPGIPEAEREKVFDRFHRLDSSDSRQVYGYGLGLHLVRRMLEAMDGGIQAESPVGGGTHMVFWLPRPAGGGGL